MTAPQITKVNRSETGMEYSTPFRPKNLGSSRAKPPPEYNLTHHGDGSGGEGFAQGLEVDESFLIHSGQDDVNKCPRQRGGHGEFRATVRADDGIKRLAEHIERNTQ